MNLTFNFGYADSGVNMEVVDYSQVATFRSKLGISPCDKGNSKIVSR
jgi:hypothetical protein